MSFNLLLVFFLCGLWHGASWSFIFWGLYHGLFLGLERTPFGKFIDTAWRPVAHGYALLVAMVGWVFFRADNLTQATGILKAMAGFTQGTGLEWHAGLFVNPKVALVLCIAVIGSTPVIPFIRDWRERRLMHGSSIAMGAGLDALVGLVITPIVLLLSVMSLASGTHNPFIYFQF